MNLRTIEIVLGSLLIHLQLLAAFGQEDPMLATMKIDVPERAILGLPIMIRIDIVADGEDARDLDFYMKLAQPEFPAPPKKLDLLPGEDEIDGAIRIAIAIGNINTEGYKHPFDEAKMAALRAEGKANLVNMPIWSMMSDRSPFVINGQELSVPGGLNPMDHNDPTLITFHDEARFRRDFGRTRIGAAYANLYNGESFSSYFFLSNASELHESLKVGPNDVDLELDFMRYVWNEERVVVEKTFTLGRQFSVHAVDLNVEDGELLVEELDGEIPSHFREWAGRELDAHWLRKSLSEPTMQAVAFGLFLSELAKADSDSDLLFDLLASFPQYQYELRLGLEFELFYRAGNKEACQLLMRKILSDHKGLIRSVIQTIVSGGVLFGVIEQDSHRTVGTLNFEGIPPNSIASELMAEKSLTEEMTEPSGSKGKASQAESDNDSPEREGPVSEFPILWVAGVILVILGFAVWQMKRRPRR